jgi:hypothetical protein
MKINGYSCDFLERYPYKGLEGPWVSHYCIQIHIDKVFEQYEEDLAAAIKTGLLEDKEISAIQATLKNLKERLKVEMAD